MDRTPLILILLLIQLACADSPRENIVDPIVAPTIEMSDPVLEGGTILIEWRYLSEGSALAEFRITREARGEAFEVGRVQVAASNTPDWQTEALRDSLIVAGVEVTYRITGFLSGGIESSSASGSITVPGTQFGKATVNPDLLEIELSWSDAPEGTVGYELLRSSDASDSELIFSTDDPQVQTYVDPLELGNTRYTYVLRTILQGGGVILSDAANAGVYTLFTTIRLDALAGIQRVLTFSQPAGSSTAINLVIGSSALIAGNNVSEQQSREALNLSDVDFGSLSAATATAAHFSADQAYHFYVMGLNEAGNQQFLSAYDWPATHIITNTIPTSTASRTGLTWFGGRLANRILSFAGATLRVFDHDLAVAEETLIAFDEPIDIDYQDGSIWLAYPDLLLKSNPVNHLSELTTWEPISIPAGSRVTAITRFRDKIALLDGPNAKVHLMDGAGEILISWNAEGQDIEKGDIATQKDGIYLYQTDGNANVHFMRPEGSTFEEIFGADL